MKWFTLTWWKYLLESPCTWKKIWCRMRGHPMGVKWYNPYGLEPDMRCRNCDDNLG